MFVNDVPMAFSVDGYQLLTEPRNRASDDIRLRFILSRTRCPHLEHGAEYPDTRWLGICLNWVEIEEVKTAASSAAPSSPPQMSASR